MTPAAEGKTAFGGAVHFPSATEPCYTARLHRESCALDVASPAKAEPAEGAMRFRLVALVLGVAHLVLVALTSGVRPEHVFFDAMLVGMPWVGPRSLALIKALLPVWITAVVVD